MRKLSLLIFSLFFLLDLSAQEYVMDTNEANDSLKQKEICLIPFQNKYYRSEVDRSMAVNEGMDFKQLRDQLRRELDRQLYMILDEDFDVVSLLKNGGEEDWELMNYIFSSTAGSYTELEAETEVQRKLLANGQIKEAPKTEGQRYMKTVVHHPPLFSTLEENLGADYYLFIGELDILMPTNVSEKEDSRYVYVHYTLYDKSGEMIDSGVKSQMLPAKKCKKIKDLSNNGFAPIGFQFKNELEAYK